MIIDPGGGGAPADGYDLIGTVGTFRVNQNNTTTPIVQITARSQQYGVQFTWDVLTSTFQADGAQTLAGLKTSQVNVICGHPQVQAFRTEADQDRSDLLYNFAIITVGTNDQTITDTVSVRMDQIGDPAAFTAIDAMWAQLVAWGAPPTG